MSILNHFGKVKTTYVPYTIKYPGITVYNLCDSGNHGFTDPFTGRVLPPRTFKYYTVKGEKIENQQTVTVDSSTYETIIPIIYDSSPYYLSEKNRYGLQDFAIIIKLITDRFNTWSKLNISPLVNPHELLYLKVDDVDSHVHHLEKMLMPVVEENQLLQHKIDVLEKAIAKGRLEKIMEENKLLQDRLEALEQKMEENNLRRMDSLEQKKLIYELD